MSVREEVLDRAKTYVSQDRNTDYGEPEDNFAAIAYLWSKYLDTKIEPHEVAILMILVKVARIKSSPNNADNWIDIAGYAACGAECVGPKDE